MTPQEYVEQVGQRMAADGCQVQWDQVGPVQALVGYRKDFKVFGQLHLTTVVAAFAPDGFAVGQFARDVSAYAKQRAGSGLGVWAGAAGFAVIVSDRVPPEAAAIAAQQPQVEFAARTQSVLVDTSARTIHTFTGTMLWGAAMNRHLRKKLQAYVVPPG